MLYEQINSNKKKSVFIVLGFILFVLLVGSTITYIKFGDFISGVILAFIVMAIYVPITLSASTKIVMKMNHAKKINSKEENRHLWYTVENLAMVARIPMPEIYIINDASPNAFASGTKPEKAAVAVTTGLLEVLNREEIEAVIAHEIAHIRNYDVRLATISIALVSVVAILADFGTRFLFGSRDRNVHPAIMILGFILLILSPLIATIIQFSISRNREFLADASGAELCRNPWALASALEKITLNDDPIEEISKSSASLYFSDPFKKKAKSLFSTHPPSEERIARLKKM